MTIVLQKILTKILTTLNALKTPTVITKGWSNIPTPSAQQYTLATLTIPAGGQYLILGRNGNGIVGQSYNSLGFTLASGQATTVTGSAGATVGTNGNQVVAWFYIKATTDCTVNAVSYGYQSTGVLSGGLVAIPIGSTD